MFIVASISIFTTHKDTWFGIYTIESQNKLSERSLAKQFTRILLDPRKLFISELMLYIRRSSVSHRKHKQKLWRCQNIPFSLLSGEQASNHREFPQTDGLHQFLIPPTTEIYPQMSQSTTGRRKIFVYVHSLDLRKVDCHENGYAIKFWLKENTASPWFGSFGGIACAVLCIWISSAVA